MPDLGQAGCRGSSSGFRSLIHGRVVSVWFGPLTCFYTSHGSHSMSNVKFQFLLTLHAGGMFYRYVGWVFYTDTHEKDATKDLKRCPILKSWKTWWNGPIKQIKVFALVKHTRAGMATYMLIMAACLRYWCAVRPSVRMSCSKLHWHH